MGIWNTGVLSIVGSTISDNPGGAGGGGSSITIADSIVTGNTGGIGGGGLPGDTLTVTDSTISDNHSEWCGGICGSSVTVTRSTVTGNGSYAGAGGIRGDELMIIDSTISGNSSIVMGAIVGGDVTVVGSTVSGNVSVDGSRGGIWAFEQVLLVNSTVTGNTAQHANGGIGSPKVTAINSTIATNTAGTSTNYYGGNAGGIGSPDVTLKNTIVAGNSGGYKPNVDGTISSRVASIVGVPAGLTLADILDPAGLADNGGPTHTMALVDSARNPALEFADPAICAAAPVDGVDQRGEPRPAGACDIGAFELQDPVARSPFTDTVGSTFYWDIEWLFDSGVTKGCTATTYCPEGSVTRGQMAAFLDRALTLPPTTTDYFTDDESSTFEAHINRLAAAGITKGCTATMFCPGAPVKRDQMASFLARALALPGSLVDKFTDDEGNTHEPNIDKVAAAGIAKGCGPTTYCPSADVTRGQMAAFLRRALE